MDKTVKFYSEEEKKEILRIASDHTINVYDASSDLARRYNRSQNAVEVKIYKTRRGLSNNNKPRRKSPKPIVLEPVIEQQQPADIGVQVPHGMTFEGTPKKIMLHSDHFRIYF
jgi:transposase-like protein